MAPRRVSLLPPLAVGLLVSTMYLVYLVLHLMPQLRRLRFLQTPDGRPLQPRLPNDPHMHPAGVTEVIGLALAFHAAFAAFIAAFWLAAVTPPGAVPRGDARWERGHFGIEPAEDAKVEDIIRNIDTDLTKVSTETQQAKGGEAEAATTVAIRMQMQPPLGHGAAQRSSLFSLPCLCFEHKHLLHLSCFLSPRSVPL